jgi:hypothetical protein
MVAEPELPGPQSRGAIVEERRASSLLTVRNNPLVVLIQPRYFRCLADPQERLTCDTHRVEDAFLRV